MRFFVIAFTVIAAASAASLSSDYLPPVVDNGLPSQEYLPPVAVGEAEPTLADDGYRYKTVRRLRLRHRRDVSELPSGEYLPPAEATQEAVAVEGPIEQPIVEAASADQQTVLADDGYRYKTVRRIRYRHRRDVNELPSGEYLPPAQEVAEVADNSVVVEAPAEEQTVLGNDGYRYKVVRRLRFRRRRRDVNELPSGEYLPPAAASQEAVAVEGPIEQPIVEAASADQQTVLADDGYRYKTVRRIRYRHRRDVNELPSGEYLPPAQEVAEVADNSVVVEAPAEEQTVLGNDGYRYKVVRRLRFRRRRRDVNELPSGEYLPPTEGDEIAIDVPADSAVLANDGYRYKTVRRLKYRRH